MEVSSLDKQTSLLVSVVVALRKAGYDPNAQLAGYLETGDPSYITRKDGARDAIEQIDKDTIRGYLNENK